MEDDLNKWKDEVKKSRMEYYQLNNYTTAQLVVLRRELGKMKTNCVVTAVDPGVMLLLYSISPDLTPAAVKDSVQNFLIERASTVNHGVETIFTEQHGKFTVQACPSSIKENLHAHHQSSNPLIGTVNVNKFEPNVILQSASVDMEQSSTTSQGKPSDVLSVKKLSGKQKETYVNLTSSYGFPAGLVLSALEHCGEDRFSAQQWCLDHMDSHAEVEAHPDDEESDSKSLEEPMDQESGPQNRASGKAVSVCRGGGHRY